MVKSPYNCVIHPLTQPQKANQKKKIQSHVVCIKTIINHDIKGPSCVNVLLTTPVFFQVTFKQDSFIDLVHSKKDDIRPINT